MGRSEALDLLRGWHDSKSLLRCEASFRGASMGLRGRALVVEEDIVRICSDDMSAELALSVREDLNAQFHLRRALEGAEYGRGVIIFFTSPFEEVTDSVAIFKIKE